jgi:hypothetical protein
VLLLQRLFFTTASKGGGKQLLGDSSSTGKDRFLVILGLGNPAIHD